MPDHDNLTHLERRIDIQRTSTDFLIMELWKRIGTLESSVFNTKQEASPPAFHDVEESTIADLCKIVFHNARGEWTLYPENAKKIAQKLRSGDITVPADAPQLVALRTVCNENAKACQKLSETAAEARRDLERARLRADKLQAFKDFVHKRLDAMGVPTEPNGPHSAAGCRIGDRLDIVAHERVARIQAQREYHEMKKQFAVECERHEKAEAEHQRELIEERKLRENAEARCGQFQDLMYRASVVWAQAEPQLGITYEGAIDGAMCIAVQEIIRLKDHNKAVLRENITLRTRAAEAEVKHHKELTEERKRREKAEAEVQKWKDGPQGYGINDLRNTLEALPDGTKWIALLNSISGREVERREHLIQAISRLRDEARKNGYWHLHSGDAIDKLLDGDTK